MKKILLLSSLALCMSVCVRTGAQAQEMLTLEQCREMALRYNKEMAAAGKQTEAARLMALSYKAQFLPNFSAGGTGLYSSAKGHFALPGGNLPVFLPDPATGIPVANGFAYFPGLSLDYKVGAVYTGGVQVEQPLYMGGRIRAAHRMSVLGHEVALLDEARTAADVMLHTDRAYVQLVKAKEMKLVAERYHTLLSELSKNVQSAHRHGLKPQNEVLKVQVKLNESELGLRRADNAIRLAAMNLCHHIGRPLTTPIDVSTELPTVVPENRVADVADRPEYGMLARQVSLAEQEVRLRRGELLPSVGVRGSYDYLHGLEVNDRVLMKQGSFSVLLNVSVPLFHFGERSNRVKAAKAKLEQTRLKQASANEQMWLELTQAANNLEEATLEVEIADRSLVQAEENMNMSRKQYEAGLEPLSDYLEAQLLWQQAWQTKVDARFLLYLQHLAYRKAAGRL